VEVNGVERAEPSKLSGQRIYAYLVAPNSSIEASLKPVKFPEGISKGDDQDRRVRRQAVGDTTTSEQVLPETP
jgi:hypothetical protein